MNHNKLLTCLPILVATLAAAGTFAGVNCPTDLSIHCGKTPSAVIANSGRLWTTFVQGQHVYVSYSDDQGAAWSSPVRVNQLPEDIYTNGENRPKIRLGTHGQIYLSWTEKTSGRHTGNIRFSYSLNGGGSFESPRTVNDDGLLTSHRFDQLHVTPSGKIYLAWLDKRDQVVRRASGNQYTGSAVYYAVSTDSGRSFGENIKVADHSCECCRLAMAPAEGDGVAVLWRHIFGANTRDHAIALLSAGGHRSGFSRATYDNWKIDACPHHGPDLARAAPGAYHMAWFSDGDAHKGIYYGRYNFSTASIESVRAIDVRPGASHPQVAEFAGHTFFVWKFFDGERTSIQVIESPDKGKTWSSQRTQASTESSSDHPILVKHSDGIYLSWHVENSYQFERLWPTPNERATSD